MITANQLLNIILFLGVAWCQDDADLQSLGEQLQSNIPELANFNQSSIPTQEEAQKVLKEKCDQNGGPNAYDDLLVIN